MNLSDKFHNHAQECQQQMAQSARDVADKATWSQIAERWWPAHPNASQGLFAE